MSIQLSAPQLGLPLVQAELDQLKEQAAAILQATDAKDAELSLRLADDAEIAELNQQFRGCSGPTDVLAFSLLEGEHVAFRGTLLGDVVIGFEVAQRQAQVAGHSLQVEISKLLIHGVLHLLGHDHQEDDEAERMRLEENRLWQVLHS